MHLKLTVHYKLGYGAFAVNNNPVESIAKFIFTQFVLVLSVWLFILNAPPLQNDPSGNYPFPQPEPVPVPGPIEY